MKLGNNEVIIKDWDYLEAGYRRFLTRITKNHTLTITNKRVIMKWFFKNEHEVFEINKDNINGFEINQRGRGIRWWILVVILSLFCLGIFLFTIIPFAEFEVGQPLQVLAGLLFLISIIAIFIAHYRWKKTGGFVVSIYYRKSFYIDNSIGVGRSPKGRLKKININREHASDIIKTLGETLFE